MQTNTLSIPISIDTVLYAAPTNGGCTSFRVDVPASTNGLFVHVDGLHASDEYVPIPSPGTGIFRYLDGAIKRVVAQGNGGTSVGVTFGVISKTYAQQ